MIAQQRIELAEDVVERFVIAEIEYQLMARQHRFVAVGRQRPFWVCSIQVAVGVDHFWFDPDSELHPQSGHVVDQRLESVGVGVG